MKKCVVIFMSLMMLLMSLRDLATYADFYLNQQYIAQNFCINMNKPELMCNGKCYLKETLSDNHETEDTKAPILTQQERTIFVLPTLLHIQISQRIPIVNQVVIAYTLECYDFEYLTKVFHPPSILS